MKRRRVKQRNFDARRLSLREHASLFETWSNKSRFLSVSRKKMKEREKCRKVGGGVTGLNDSFAGVHFEAYGIRFMFSLYRQRFPALAMNSRCKKFEMQRRVSEL